MNFMYSVPAWHIIGPLFLIYLIVSLFRIISLKEDYSLLRYGFVTSFVVYLLGVVYFVFLPLDISFGMYANQAPWYSSINFIPVTTLDSKTFVLNIYMLIPLGIYLPLLGKGTYSIKQAMIHGFLFSLSIELMQLVFRLTLGNYRSTDVNDLIANTLGCVIGFLLIEAIMKVNVFRTVMVRGKI